MAFPDVKVIPGKGSSGQQAPGEDFISGIIFYTNSLPSGFSSTDRIKQVFSVADAETLGVLADYSDETQAKFTIPISGVGSTGDTIEPKFANPITGVTTSLVVYAQVAGDTTATILAASIATAINNNTSANGGFTATSSTTNLIITVPKGLGIAPNSGTPMTTTIVGGITVGSITNSTPGVASLLAIWHYHIAEFFRANVSGNLFVSFNAVPGSANAYTYAEVSAMQTYANGKIRNFAVYAPKNYAASAANVRSFISTATGLLQTQYTTVFNGKQPGQILFATDLVTLSGMSNLTLDLATLSGNRVTTIIGQDGANQGYALFKQAGYSITNIGCALGTMSKSLVSDDIGDLSQFNLTDGSELSVPAFADGTLVKNVSTNLVAQLDLFRYVFFTTYQGYTGVYFNNDHTSVSYGDQFSYVHFGRTWDKASRLLYAAYLPFLKAKLTLDGAGNLAVTTVATLKAAGEAALDGMVRDNELSGYTVTVPANQNPNKTRKLQITVNLLAEAIANEIDITSQFVASL